MICHHYSRPICNGLNFMRDVCVPSKILVFRSRQWRALEPPREIVVRNSDCPAFVL